MRGMGPVDGQMSASTPGWRTRAEGPRASDSDLVDRARAGDTQAFGELYGRHRGAVLTAVASRVRGRELQHDIVQEAFTTALAKLDLLSDPARFRPWVLQISRNAATDLLRQRQRRGVDEAFDDLPAPPASKDPGPDSMAELHELERDVSAAFRKLSQRDATALALSVYFGFGPADMAAALGVTPNNAKVILHRARQRLRLAIGPSAAAS